MFYIYRSIHMPRPVTYEQVKAKVEEMFSSPLNISFTQANGEVSCLPWWRNLQFVTSLEKKKKS